MDRLFGHGYHHRETVSDYFDSLKIDLLKSDAIPCHIIHQKGTKRSSIVRTSNSAETFLACSIPNLKRDNSMVLDYGHMKIEAEAKLKHIERQDDDHKFHTEKNKIFQSSSVGLQLHLSEKTYLEFDLLAIEIYNSSTEFDSNSVW